ncbi:uncharacterized protein LOC110053406 [Orbicella faveolata]|uniref:uncharacterized protein LOC110053406 n=1 Tax=Orbicella faveolata TaxID=48498 RepID=UPI0009E5CF22|nr:uncharacterized protein LOC110053406 [Orbicella faveolata]
MQPLKDVFFVILIQRVVYFAAFAADEESLSRSAYFTTHENKRLQGHVVKRFESPSLMSCSQLCLRNSWCTSTNFMMSSKKDDKGTCELNKHDINEDIKFHDQEDVTFSLLLKGCLMTGCLNGGSCLSDDKKQTFSCLCTEPWTGKKCDAIKSGLTHSTIIGGDISYQSHLYQFLTPAFGLNPHWVLCYRASTYGWAASTFHSRCDGKRNTVTIIKNGVYVFGGYADIPWDTTSSFGSTSNAFIFSLRNKEGLGPFKSMVTKPSYAIVKMPNFGPTFGDGYDILIVDNANSNIKSYTDFGNSYSVPSGVQDNKTILAGTMHFTPDEMEVFYLG